MDGSSTSAAACRLHEEPGTFGALLRGYRARAGLTQVALAAHAALGVRTVRDLEHDRVRQPQRRVLARLAAALDLSAAEQARLGSTVPGRPDVPDGSGRSDGSLRIDVLGPLRIRHGGRPVDVGPPKHQLLLGLLAVQPDQPVPVCDIVDVLWDRPPRSCRALVQTYLTRVRRLVGAAHPGAGRAGPATGPVIVRDRHGYRLALPADRVDAGRFRTLVERAARAHRRGQLDRAVELFCAGLACWRGPLLAGTGSGLLRHPAAAALSRHRLDCVLTLADLAFATGVADRVTAPLAQVAEVEQWHEGLHARLMLALASTGEQASALRLFGRLRARLADELGVLPGAELRAAHLRVLRQQVPGADGRPA